jgi:hypothetical protein
MRVSTNACLPGLDLFRIGSKFRSVWSRPLLYLHDVALNGRDALPPCCWFAKLKQRCKDWWVSYLRRRHVAAGEA